MTEADAAQQAGVLWIVATPIGNLSDLSARAAETLAGVDLILAEDTRHSRRLLEHYGIRQPLRSLHEHNEAARVESLLEQIGNGARMALICDAGTPLVSDPGYRLVAAARERGLLVSPLPGPCAAIAALSVAGLPSDRFVFEGFLPARRAARRAHLLELAQESRTLLFYESPRRLEAMLADAAEAFGPQRHAAVARELTKLHEQIACGSLARLLERMESGDLPARGEVVVVIAGAAARSSGASVSAEALLLALLPELSTARAAAITARLTGVSRQELYERAVTLRRRED